MKKLLTLLILLTACQSQPIIPPGDPGQIVAHFDFIELPDGKGDTLKCITYTLKNESLYDYYVLWPISWGLSLTTHLGDTSWCNTYLAIGGLEFYRLNEDLSQPYIDEKYRKQIETVLRPYLLEQRQHSNSYFFLDKKSYDKVKDKLFQRRMNKILRTKIPADTSYTQIFFKSLPPYFPPRVNWVYADKLPAPLYLIHSDPIPKLWYYDPEPYSKYKSYYPYLGQVICRDTIIVPTKYLWE